MKTLQRFWHWVDNEKPGPLDAAGHAHRDVDPPRGTLSLDAITALEEAAALIVHHVRPFARPGSKWHSVYYCFGTDAKRDHLRALSLALCPLLTRMQDDLAVEPGTPEEKARAEERPEHRTPVGAVVLMRIKRICAGCGLSSNAEPSVLHPRPDGVPRCNDCEIRRTSGKTSLFLARAALAERVMPLGAFDPSATQVTCPQCAFVQHPLSSCQRCSVGFVYPALVAQ